MIFIWISLTVILCVIIVLILNYNIWDCDLAYLIPTVVLIIGILALSISSFSVLTYKCFDTCSEVAKIKVENKYESCLSLIDKYKEGDVRYPEVISAIQEYNTLIEQEQLKLKSIYYKDFTYDFYNEMELVELP